MSYNLTKFYELLTVKNSLAYYDMDIITTVKSFIVQARVFSLQEQVIF